MSDSLNIGVGSLDPTLMPSDKPRNYNYPVGSLEWIRGTAVEESPIPIPASSPVPIDLGTNAYSGGSNLPIGGGSLPIKQNEITLVNAVNPIPIQHNSLGDPILIPLSNTPHAVDFGTEYYNNLKNTPNTPNSPNTPNIPITPNTPNTPNNLMNGQTNIDSKYLFYGAIGLGLILLLKVK